MVIILPFILFITGLVFVVGGAELLVRGASSLAKRLSVPEIVIGLTVVAFGTSTPELAVNIFSSIKGQSGIVFGNVIGSNIFNILAILGISGLIYPLAVPKNTVWNEIPFSLFAAILLLFLVNDSLLFPLKKDALSLLDGLILLGFFVVFIVYSFKISKVKSSDTFEVFAYQPYKIIIFILLGFAGLFLGGKLVVDNAVIIAQKLSISDKVIALTVISAGTSLPELATSAVAAYRKKPDIAVGNIVGSNIFNILFILGISSVVKTATFNPVLNIDLLVLVVSSFLLFVIMFTGDVRKIDRWEAGSFLVMYMGYLIYLILRK